jgi:MbtH protein
MRADERSDTALYIVVLNHEEQYSIWPIDRDIPRGWQDAGKTGSREECLAHIKAVWTDMRPLSLRRQMTRCAADATRQSQHGDEDARG